LFISFFIGLALKLVCIPKENQNVNIDVKVDVKCHAEEIKEFGNLLVKVIKACKGEDPRNGGVSK
jgi:hypothetical protein